MSVRVLMSLVTVAALSLPLAAQTRPNFAGKWELIPEKSIPARPAGGPPMPPMTISQDANTFTMSHLAFTPVPGTQERRDEIPYTLTYTVDGVDHPEPTPVPPLPPVQPLASMAQPEVRPGQIISRMSVTDQMYRAVWTRDQLVIMSRSTSKVEPQTGPNSLTSRRVIRKVYSIDSDGLLIVESLTVAEPAMNGPSQPTPVPARSVYRKVS